MFLELAAAPSNMVWWFFYFLRIALNSHSLLTSLVY